MLLSQSATRDIKSHGVREHTRDSEIVKLPSQ